MWIGLGTSHYYEGVRGDCCRPGLWFAVVSPHWAVLIFKSLNIMGQLLTFMKG